MDRYMTDENVHFASNNNFDCNNLRKQVRFDTPSKSDPRLLDLQNPKPFFYGAKTPTSATLANFNKPLHSIENVMHNHMDQPHPPVENFRNSHPMNDTFHKNGIPKPCDALELSVFDSANNTAQRSNFHNFNRHDLSDTFESNFRNARVCDDEMPSRMLPGKTPISKFAGFDRSRDVFEVAAKTTIPISEDRYREKHKSGFFTLPNSNSNVLDEERSQQKIYEYKNNFREEGLPVRSVRIPKSHMKKYKKQTYEVENEQPHVVAPKSTCNTCNCAGNSKQTRKSNSSFKENANINPMSNGADEKRNAIMMLAEKTKCEVNANTEPHCVPNLSNNVDVDVYQPNISDLFGLIRIQNEQLRLLQQQVNILSNFKNCSDNMNQMSAPRDCVKYSENEMYTVQKITRNHQNHNDKIDEEIHKISIGVMTSFEVTLSSNAIQNPCKVGHVDEGIQTSVNSFDRKKPNSVINIADNALYRENGIQTVNFLDGLERCNKQFDNSDAFQDPITSTKVVMDESAMPNSNYKNHNVQSKSTDMNNIIKTPLYVNPEDYDCSDDEYSGGIGWTFYNNVMNHVNKLLRKAPGRPQKRNQKLHKQRKPISEMNQIGFNNVDVNSSTSKKVTFNFGNSPPLPNVKIQSKPTTETSLHINKLAAKYLDSNGQEFCRKEKISPAGTSSKPCINNLTNEMSFATMQYMQKHNLLPGAQAQVPKTHEKKFRMDYKDDLRPFQYHKKPTFNGPTKILDITALKQQPKLL